MNIGVRKLQLQILITYEYLYPKYLKKQIYNTFYKVRLMQQTIYLGAEVIVVLIPHVRIATCTQSL